MTVPYHLSLPVGAFRSAAFAAAVRQRRLSCALTCDGLAALAGVPTEDVEDIEAARTLPSIDTLWALTDALSIDAADLLHDARREAQRRAVALYGRPDGAAGLAAL